MSKTHWDNLYASKKPTEVSWHQTHLEKSLELIRATGVNEFARIIDVGGGASTLVDDLLATGFRNVTVLDIASAAIRNARARLGKRADDVTWLEADITRVDLPAHHYDLWHDRAVFHFLTDVDDRRRYLEAVNHTVKSGGHVIVATFGPHGPRQCSGLDIVRYAPESLQREFGADYRLVQTLTEDHVTPAGKHQEFIYCYCRKS
ncbi:MAG TPA: class I SAM-dependent methyltransferase [Candidatus Methylomirabilis sp.]|nr:class I SAM-dependent methyltransferase [Candidatus Methylomirabilis sp.]